MKPHLLLRRGLLLPLKKLLLLGLLLPATAQAREDWIRVETPHFRVFAQASEAAARGMAVELEQLLRCLYATLGTPAEERVVYVLGISSRHEFESFWPLFEGRPRSVPGYSLLGPQRSYILVASDTERTVLRHEYAHLFVHQRYGHLPLWLDEGLAELFSSARSSGHECWVGETHPRYRENLHRQLLLPLNVFFSVNQQSPLYGDRSGPNLFYAQAWATAHFLVLGAERPQFGKLHELAHVLAQGRPATMAVSQVFGVPTDRLEASLEAYVRQPSWPRLRVRLGESEPIAIKVAGAAESEIAFHLADVFAQAQRYDEARQRFEQALQRFADFAPLHEQLGWLALWQDDHLAAEVHFTRAIAASSRDAEVYFLHAKLALERRDENAEAAPPTPESLATVRADLRHALEFNPNHARAHGLLGFTFLITRMETGEAIAELERAIVLEPSEAGYRIHLAQAYMQKQAWALAQRTLEEALALAREAGVRASIEQMLHYLANVTPPR